MQRLTRASFSVFLSSLLCVFVRARKLPLFILCCLPFEMLMFWLLARTCSVVSNAFGPIGLDDLASACAATITA